MPRKMQAACCKERAAWWENKYRTGLRTVLFLLTERGRVSAACCSCCPGKQRAWQVEAREPGKRAGARLVKTKLFIREAARSVCGRYYARSTEDQSLGTLACAQHTLRPYSPWHSIHSIC